MITLPHQQVRYHGRGAAAVVVNTQPVPARIGGLPFSSSWSHAIVADCLKDFSDETRVVGVSLKLNPRINAHENN